MKEEKLYTIQVGRTDFDSTRIPVVCDASELEKIATAVIGGWRRMHNGFPCACVAAAGDWTHANAFRGYPQGVECYQFCDCM